MTTESRMREALEDFRDTILNQRGALAENGMTNDQVNDVLNEFDSRFHDLLEALSPPARIPVINPDREYEWVGRDEIRYRVSTTFGVLSLSYYHEWNGRFEGIDIDDADNVRAELAAAIATLAGLEKEDV